MTQDTLIGKTIGDYKLIRRLGRGGMATVYLAQDSKLQREVAFKLLHNVDAADESFVARFRQEALATAKLEHPNIIHIYDYGTDGQLTYMVTEYCPNGSLNDLLSQMAGRGETMEPEYAVYIASQIALALNFAHQNGVVHRDVKPGNIFFARDNRPVLADLGIAKALEGPKLTRTMTAIGTPEYMAPEQGRGDASDYRSDLYSLGVVLYEMLSGRPPYQANTPWGIVHQHISEPLPSLRAYNPKISPALTVAVERALAKNPAERYQSGAEMAQALQRALKQSEAGAAGASATVVMRPAWAPPPSPPTPPPVKASPQRRGSRALVGVLALLAALVALLLVATSVGLPQRLLRPQTAGATQQPVVQAPVVSPTQEQQIAVVSTPTSEIIAAVQMTPTVSATAVPVAEVPIATPLPPTSTPITRNTRAADDTPTEQPATPTRVSPSPTQAPPTPQQTATATLPPAPVKPGLILDFEAFGTWERGNEPYGTFAPSKEKTHEGASSGKLIYDIPAVDNNYVVFLREPVAPIPGKPETLTAWVYGDGSGLFLNAWIQDSQGEVRQFPLGRIQHSDSWQPMVLTLDPAAPWPQAHISGSDNNKIDYPVSLVGFVLDAEGSSAKSGQIFIDELTIGGTGAAPVVVAGTPTPAASEATPTSNPAPATALSGRIAYTSGGAVMAVDSGTRATWSIAPNARQPEVRGPWVLANGSGGGRDNVFIASINGGGERITGMHPEDAYPSWSPSGESAAFSSTIIDGQERIFVQWDMTHQEEPTMVKVGGADVFGRNPTWMDNWRIAFTGCNYWADGSKCGIWAVAADDSAAPYRLTDQADDVSSDSSGGNLLYQSRATGNWDVYSVPAGGGTPRNLTNSPSQDSGATFSPDGRSVAFMSDRDGSWGIWVIGLDGSNPQKVLAVPGGFGGDWPNERLSWSS